MHKINTLEEWYAEQYQEYDEYLAEFFGNKTDADKRKARMLDIQKRLMSRDRRERSKSEFGNKPQGYSFSAGHSRLDYNKTIPSRSDSAFVRSQRNR